MIYPSLLSPSGGVLVRYIRGQREGDPERINQTPWARCWKGVPGRRRGVVVVVVVVVSFRFVPALPLPGGKDEQDLGRNMVGGRSLRSWIEGVFAAWCANGYLFPRAGG